MEALDEGVLVTFKLDSILSLFVPRFETISDWNVKNVCQLKMSRIFQMADKLLAWGCTRSGSIARYP